MKKLPIPSREHLQLGAYLLLTSLLIIWPALYNRYPLMYFDSGAYMEMSVSMLPSPHRAFGYAYLIKVFGWTITNWVLIGVQGLLVSVGLLQLLALFSSDRMQLWRHFISVVLLSFFTSLPCYAAQLMPDIFTFILAISLLILLVSQNLSRAQLWWHAIILFVGLLTHYAHLPLVLLVGIAWLLIGSRYALFKIPNLRWAYIAAPLVFAFLSICTVNAIHDRGFGMGTASNVFLVANLGEMGLLGPYLNENCDDGSLVFCDMKDNLPLETGGYLWDADGPVQQFPGGWMAMNEACAPIVRDFLTQPKWMAAFLWSSLKSTVQQMFQIELGSGLQYNYAQGPPAWPMKTHYTYEYNEFMTSVQNKGDKLPLQFFQLMNYLGLLVTLLLIARGVHSGLIDVRLMALLIGIALIYVFHAAITGVLANVYERLQCRVLPLWSVAALLVYFQLPPLIFKWRL